MIYDSGKKVSRYIELILRIVYVKAKLRVQKSDHACKEFFLLIFIGKFKFSNVFDGFFNRNLFFIDLYKLSLGLLLYLIWHLGLAHLWKV